MDSSSPESFSQLTSQEQMQAEKIANEIDITSSRKVLEFGCHIQQKVGTFSDSLLKNVRNKEAGHAGENLKELLLTIKGVDTKKLTAQPNFFQRMFSLIQREVSGYLNSFEKISDQLDFLSRELNKEKQDLIVDVNRLELLIQENLNYFRELNVYICAGDTKKQTAVTQQLKPMQDLAHRTGDPIDAQRAHDLESSILRFDKRLHDLKLSRQVILQSIPQIRLIQLGNNTLADKIQSSLLNTLPLWKNSIVMAIALHRQKNAASLQRKVLETTDSFLQKNSELLRKNAVSIAEQNEQGIISIETLEKSKTDLIEGIQEILKIQTQGKQDREKAQIVLSQSEKELAESLLSLKDIKK